MKWNYKIIGGLYATSLILLAVLPLNTSRVDNVWVLSWRGDYWIHMLQFIPCIPVFSKIGPLSVSLAFGVGLAIITEGVQWWLPYRAFNINDLMANGLGVILGFFFVIILSILKNFLSTSTKTKL
ncbi:MAG: VanZ family protein [Bacteroidales bacterium]|nr:VanZ family protein [Bacteroidales bacterium]